MVDETKALTGAELSAKRLADAAEERKKNAGKPGYSVAGVKRNGNRHGVTFCASAAKERSIGLKKERSRKLFVAKRRRCEVKRTLKRLKQRGARKGLPYYIKDRKIMAEMAAIAERAEKAGELNIASNMYKELAQYAAPKRKAAEPKILKDKNLLTMSEEELLLEIARLESSVG